MTSKAPESLTGASGSANVPNPPAPPPAIFDFTRQPGFYDAVINCSRADDGSVNWVDVIAMLRGWNPLQAGAEMTVRFGGNEYLIKRNRD